MVNTATLSYSEDYSVNELIVTSFYKKANRCIKIEKALSPLYHKKMLP